MNTEKILLDGQIEALRDAIRGRIHALTFDTFEGYVIGGVYTCLGRKISDAETLLEEIRSLLNTLKTLDPRNN